jgi:hypothetical protein
MALFNKQISSLINGISQQPDSTKYDSQSRLQENFLSSAATGLMKRAPTTFIKNLGVISEEAYIRVIDRDKHEKYILVVDGGTIRVFDISGEEKVVNAPQGMSYLNLASGISKQEFSSLTIADTTILLNKTVTVDKESITVPARDPEALVVVREGKYGKRYSIKLFDATGGLLDTAEYQVPDGSDSSHTAAADTTNIAAGLTASLLHGLNLSGITGYTVVQEGNLIWITNPNDFEIATEDGFGDIAMYPIKDSVALFSDLPIKAPDGFRTAIAGDTNGVVSSSYIVEAKKNSDVALQGIEFPATKWVESNKPGVSLGFVSSTAPHALRREANGEFTFEPIEYGARVVGDEDTAEDPSFVDDKINGIFFNANRLGFLSSESVSLSEAGNFFGFYPTSVATLLAADPVIFTVSSPDVAILRHAVPFNEQVILFSDKHQFVMTSEGNINNSSVGVQSATDFEINSNVAPLVAGNNIYFANNQSAYTEVREYFVADFAANKDAANVTAHVPSYIPSGVNWIASADNARTVIMTSEQDLSTMYVYQVMWSGNEKLQSAWHEFNFNGYEIIGGDFIGTRLYFMIRKVGTSEVILETIDFADTPREYAAEYIIYVDNRVRSDETDVTVSYNAVDNATTFTLPYVDEDRFVVINGDTSDVKYGNQLTYTISGYDVVVPGDKTLSTLWFGNTYSSKYQFGSVYLKESTNNGEKAVTAGRTQVLKALINYDNTAQFDVVVELEGRQAKTTSFFGRVKGGIASIFGKVAIATGVFKIPVNGLNNKTKITIENNSHLPSNIQFAEFLVRYQNNTGRRAP